MVILSSSSEYSLVPNSTSRLLNDLEKQVTLEKLAENEGYGRKKFLQNFTTQVAF